MPTSTLPPVPTRPTLGLLSNGRYTVMLDAAGSGFSHCRGRAVTRWREDPVANPWGSYLLLRDQDNGTPWSITPQPYGITEAGDSVAFEPGVACFGRRHGDLEATLEIAVATDADLELRRVTLTNHGDAPRTLSLTSYAELVLGPTGDDNAHPAFSKMFVQTEWDAAHYLLLATRRRRDRNETPVWAAHALQVEGDHDEGDIQFESDRARFLGRARTLRDARAMQPGATLSGTCGCVLDPVFSLRRQVTVAPGERVRVLAWTQVADSREAAVALAQRMHAADAGDQAFAMARQRAIAECESLGIDDARAACFAAWAHALLLCDATWRAPPEILARGRGGAPTLWAKGISGDRPILLTCIDGDDDTSLARVHDVLLAQRHWQAQQLGIDVVLLDGSDKAIGERAQATLAPLVETQQAQLKADDDAVKAELFCLRDSDLDERLRDGLYTVARIVLGAAGTPTRADTDTPDDATVSMPALPVPTRPAPAADSTTPDPLEFANGIGGFAEGGRAYRIELDDDHVTPAPWVNVIANPDFGCMASAEGGGYAWSVNSQQNTLTPWPNDPVSDTPHDILYLRDADSGAVWSATALPIRVAEAHYRVTHGKGWSRFDNDAHGIDLELTQCVPPTDPVKLSRLRLCNRSTRTRRLSLTAYVQWMLGANGTTPAPFVVTACDPASGALLARNRWRADFGEHVAFLDLGGTQQSCSGDRGSFLGPLGDVAQPAALRTPELLDGRLGAGLDPCGALQTHVELAPGMQADLLLVLGDAPDADSAQRLIAKYRDTSIDDVLEAVRAQWDDLLDTVQVRTPDRALDLMLNHWLPYQVLSCRVWARTAYYQASGAYGFRDQLQDVAALCLARPDVARAQVLRAAGRQFDEGDVQHWWLPPSGQGVRTRISDDRGWLAYIAAHYVAVTGDRAVLDEELPFLEGPAIADGATDAFFQPSPSAHKASVYEHCACAIDASLTRGAHGLPLIGTGDWNDGYNAVGAAGRGESTWLGWFLLAVIDAFAPHAERRGDDARVTRWKQYADALRDALEQAWDGQWYRRGYYDNGAPLGSHTSTECKIDCIAQSWSLIAGATDAQRSAQAMASTERLLVDQEHAVARLFTPPFDQCDENPGYIKGYPPGVRENGGQYTHGALWSVFGWAALGDGDRAGALFDLLNPVRHADTPEAVQRYKVEPYVSCADVYSVAPHIGRGGWTWYSGSAGWLYRAGLEALLGFHRRGDHLLIDPCIPSHWPGFEVVYRHRGARHVTRYEITVENAGGTGYGASSTSIALVDDGQTHQVRIVLHP